MARLNGNLWNPPTKISKLIVIFFSRTPLILLLLCHMVGYVRLRLQKATKSVMSNFLSEASAAAYPDTVEGVGQMYDRWAQTYDPELKEFGYNAPTNCIDNLEKWIKKDKEARIMDIACGTGLVGEELLNRGYKHLTIDGVDISKDSVQICEKKKIYNRLICDSVGIHKLDIDDGMYDAVVCVGCFIPNHLTQACFPELVRITKQGGLVLITMKVEYFEKGEGFDEGRFEGAIQALVQQDIWEELARDPVEGYFGKHKGVTLVFRVLQK